jgi:NAD(P)-dependent dehydrogenase (short-subunit alcohol dehydrogenase family)
MNGKLAIVTGAASGIGLAVAVRLAGDRRVALVDIDGPGVERAAAGIGAAARGFEADVSSSESCARVVAAADGFGEIEALVNVAGVMAAADTVEDLGDEALDRILDVNVKAIFRLGRHVVPLLRRRGGGVIVNVASVHAFATMPQTAAYAASKGAVVALTRQMALDFAGDGIRVVAVAPGSVDTPLTRQELARRHISLENAGFSTDPRAVGRVASPAEVAEVVAWLLSPGAALLTGSTVTADAGLLARLV